VSLDRWCYPRGLIHPPGAVEFAGAPLRLYERGMWIAGDEYWGEPEGVVPVPLVEVIAGGARADRRRARASMIGALRLVVMTLATRVV
jgi:hypothetical protein